VNSSTHRPRQPRATIRMEACLDTMTRTKLEDLATQCHSSRAPVLREVMRRGLSREPSGHVNRDDIQDPVRHLVFVVESELHRQVRKVAETGGGDVAP